MAVVPDAQPAPEVQVLIEEECQLLLDALPDETLQQLAIRKLEGFTNEEIGRLQGCSLATVERKLARIVKSGGDWTSHRQNDAFFTAGDAIFLSMNTGIDCSGKWNANPSP